MDGLEEDLEANITMTENNILALKELMIPLIAELTEQLDFVVRDIVRSANDECAEHHRERARGLLARQLWYEHLDWVFGESVLHLRQAMFAIRATQPIIGLANFADVLAAVQVEATGGTTMEDVTASRVALQTTLNNVNGMLTTIARGLNGPGAMHGINHPNNMVNPVLAVLELPHGVPLK